MAWFFISLAMAGLLCFFTDETHAAYLSICLLQTITGSELASARLACRWTCRGPLICAGFRCFQVLGKAWTATHHRYQAAPSRCGVRIGETWEKRTGNWNFEHNLILHSTERPRHRLLTNFSPRPPAASSIASALPASTSTPHAIRRPTQPADPSCSASSPRASRLNDSSSSTLEFLTTGTTGITTAASPETAQTTHRASRRSPPAVAGSID